LRDARKRAASQFRSIFSVLRGSDVSGYNPARTGRVLVDAARGNVVRYEEEASGFPEKSGADRFTFVEWWDYLTIGAASYLVPVWAGSVLHRADGSMERATTEFKNHRHFEATARIAFGKDK
jgi:hypothetical protein